MSEPGPALGFFLLKRPVYLAEIAPLKSLYTGEQHLNVKLAHPPQANLINIVPAESC